MLEPLITPERLIEFAEVALRKYKVLRDYPAFARRQKRERESYKNALEAFRRACDRNQELARKAQHILLEIELLKRKPSGKTAQSQR